MKAPPPAPSRPRLAPPPTVEQLEDANRYADDKERMSASSPPGLRVDRDPYRRRRHPPRPSRPAARRAKNKAHVAQSVYTELLLVLLALAVVMLVTAWFRKRLYLGVAMALYGLAVFNLKYWGFGVPFLLFGAWLMVRSYRAQKALREATGDTGRRSSPAPTAPRAPGRISATRPPRPNPSGPPLPRTSRRPAEGPSAVEALSQAAPDPPSLRRARTNRATTAQSNARASSASTDGTM